MKQFNAFKKFIKDKEKIYRIAIVMIFAWFILITGFVAATVKFNIASDEGFHWEFINIYRDRKSFLPFIKNQTSHFNLRDITREPSYLYHYLFGLLFKIKPLQKVQLTILRIFNIGFNVLNLFVLLKILDELTKNKWIKLLTLFITSNTLMYFFLSMGVNYDNLINLLASVSILLTIKFMKYHKAKQLFLFGLVGLIGMLVKYSFGPLLLVNSIIIFTELYFLYKEKKKLSKIIKDYSKEISQYSKIIIILTTVCIAIFSGLFIERYGVNLIKYHTLKEPNCAEIHSVDKCLQSGVFKRNYNLLQKLKEDPTRDDFTIIDFTKNWFKFMTARTFGMMVHKWMDPSPFIITSFIITSTLSLLFFIRYFDLHKDKKNRTVFIIATFYTVFLFYFVNFSGQKKYGSLGLAVQGRYIFPVLGIWFYFLNRNIIKRIQILNKKTNLKIDWLKYLYAIFIIIMFIQGGIYWYIHEAGKDWYKNDTKPEIVEWAD